VKIGLLCEFKNSTTSGTHYQERIVKAQDNWFLIRSVDLASIKLQ
jgi:hypothetical protein